MEITFKNSEDFFYTAVHPSGYHIAKLPSEIELDDSSSVSTYVPTILPNNEKEVLSKKKISLTEFFMDIESFRKECASPSEEKLFANDNFIEKLVNKYGFLEGTTDFWLSIRKVSPMISSFAQYNSFMSGEIIEGIPSVMLNDQRLSESYLKKESLGLWIWLLKLNFFKPNTKNPNNNSLKSAGWSREIYYEDKLLSNSFPKKDPLSDKIILEPSCLGTAYLFFRYSKNITETKRCLNCQNLFADASRSNNQKFCSEKCRVSAYRERQINRYKKEIEADFGSFREIIGSYEYLEIKFNDLIKNQIRRKCKIHGEFITKTEKLQNDPGCPKCRVIKK